MTAFGPNATVPVLEFKTVDFRDLTVRPVLDEDSDRNVVELGFDGLSIRIDNGTMIELLEGLKCAALLGELENTARKNPTPYMP